MRGRKKREVRFKATLSQFETAHGSSSSASEMPPRRSCQYAAELPRAQIDDLLESVEVAGDAVRAGVPELARQHVVEGDDPLGLFVQPIEDRVYARPVAGDGNGMCDSHGAYYSITSRISYTNIVM